MEKNHDQSQNEAKAGGSNLAGSPDNGDLQHLVDAEPPPILGSWNAMYAVVLILHVIILLLFYFITKYYS